MTGGSPHFGCGSGVGVGTAVGAAVGWTVGDGALVVAAVSVRATLPLEHAASKTASASEETRITGCTLV